MAEPDYKKLLTALVELNGGLVKLPEEYLDSVNDNGTDLTVQSQSDGVSRIIRLEAYAL